MGIARDAQQLMVLRGEKIYHSMKADIKAIIKDHKARLRTHPKCFTGRYNTIVCSTSLIYVCMYICMHVMFMGVCVCT